MTTKLTKVPDADFNSAPVSLQQMIDAAAALWAGAAEADFEANSEYLRGQVELIHDLQVQPWHAWETDVAKSWIESAIKERATH